MSRVRAGWFSSSQDVLMSYTLNKSFHINTRGICINSCSHFVHDVNICRPHQGVKLARLSREGLDWTRRFNLSKQSQMYFQNRVVFCGKCACQAWVIKHLQTIIVVSFDCLQDEGELMSSLVKADVNSSKKWFNPLTVMTLWTHVYES